MKHISFFIVLILVIQILCFSKALAQVQSPTATSTPSATTTPTPTPATFPTSSPTPTSTPSPTSEGTPTTSPQAVEASPASTPVATSTPTEEGEVPFVPAGDETLGEGEVLAPPLEDDFGLPPVGSGEGDVTAFGEEEVKLSKRFNGVWKLKIEVNELIEKKTKTKPIFLRLSVEEDGQKLVGTLEQKKGENTGRIVTEGQEIVSESEINTAILDEGGKKLDLNLKLRDKQRLDGKLGAFDISGKRIAVLPSFKELLEDLLDVILGNEPPVDGGDGGAGDDGDGGVIPIPVPLPFPGFPPIIIIPIPFPPIMGGPPVIDCMIGSHRSACCRRECEDTTGTSPGDPVFEECVAQCICRNDPTIVVVPPPITSDCFNMCIMNRPTNPFCASRPGTGLPDIDECCRATCIDRFCPAT